MKDMDTSEQYVLMCQKAQEIQAMWEPKAGDFYRCQLTDDSEVHVYVIGIKDMKWFPRYHRHWLPRLDQLLDTIYGLTPIHWKYRSNNPVEQLNNLLKEYGTGECFARTSLSHEEYFLQVMMYELYRKTWDGEDWI